MSSAKARPVAVGGQRRKAKGKRKWEIEKRKERKKPKILK